MWMGARGVAHDSKQACADVGAVPAGPSAFGLTSGNASLSRGSRTWRQTLQDVGEDEATPLEPRPTCVTRHGSTLSQADPTVDLHALSAALVNLAVAGGGRPPPVSADAYGVGRAPLPVSAPVRSCCAAMVQTWSWMRKAAVRERERNLAVRPQVEV